MGDGCWFFVVCVVGFLACFRIFDYVVVIVCEEDENVYCVVLLLGVDDVDNNDSLYFEMFL